MHAIDRRNSYLMHFILYWDRMETIERYIYNFDNNVIHRKERKIIFVSDDIFSVEVSFFFTDGEVVYCCSYQIKQYRKKRGRKDVF